jgi:hypothetical protein
MIEAEKRKYIMSEEYREEMENMLANIYWFMRTESGQCFPMEWGPGWLDEFAELCRQLQTEVSGDFQWVQLKEKYGTARCYYWGHITPYGEELIKDFEIIFLHILVNFAVMKENLDKAAG